MKRFVALALALVASPALADEGMWTFDNFPAEKVEQKYGFRPSQEWLDKVRLSSARLAGGCSASFVSPNGLVMTNHHCAHECIAELSSAKQDYVANGYYAKTAADEKQCPAMEVNQLVEIRDVTAEIGKATAGKTGKAYSTALKAAQSRIEKGCATGENVRCDVVTLYNGGKYDLYKYRRFQDVRLVFAPELDIAFFGGDPDNFMFPRYNLDVSFLRVYENGKPAQLENWFAWSKGGAQAGELTFTSGHPGRTSRLLSMSELAFERDVVLPQRLLYLAEMRGMLNEYGHGGAEQKRLAQTDLFYIENAVKALRGRHEALLDRTLWASKEKEEQKLRGWVNADPARQQKFGKAWDEMAASQDAYAPMFEELMFAEGSGRGFPWGFQSQLFLYARTLVRAADEMQKPNEQRLREYNEANLPAVQAGLFSEAPVYGELEELKLAYSLTKLRENLGTDHPYVQAVLGKKSPETLARELVRGTKLGDPKVRRKLYQGGSKAVAASNDPMIELARRIDPQTRAIRSRFEEQVEAAEIRAGEQIARARFEAFGTSTYPDATFTLRLSYGAVEGYDENGRHIDPITQFGGLFERATGEDPYALPKRWLDAKKRIDLATPYNFASTNDIIGGNSGSPVIDRNAQIVGLIFDGNLQSLGGEYGFDAAVNRAVSVHSEGILEALRKVYGADRILHELQPAEAAAR